MPPSREQDYRLYLVTRSPFDPREISPPDDQREAAWYIVQFTEPLTFETRERLIAMYGLRLSDYLPNLAYLEWLEPKMWRALSKDKLYRSSLLYTPSDKISPRISGSAEEEYGPTRFLRVVLFPNVDEEDKASFIELLSALLVSAEKRYSNQEEATRFLIKSLDDRPLDGDLQIVFASLPRDVLLEKIASRPEVRWIEEAGKGDIDCDPTAERTPGGLIQSGHIGHTPLWDRSIQGQGQVIGVTDDPINVQHCMFFDNGAAGPMHRKLVGNRHLRQFDSRALHGQHVAALAAGHDTSGHLCSNRGMAWQAKLSLDDMLLVIENDVTLLPILTSQAADGAFIHSNSWHKGFAYDQLAVTTDTFVWNNEENLVCGSSANAGGGEVMGAPGTAKNTLSVSASKNHPNHMEFGDGIAGPVSDDDERRKPDICAPGEDIATAGELTCNAIDIDCASSWATPIIAGAAALVRQYYTEGWYPTGTKRKQNELAHPSAALLKATLLNSTVDMTGVDGYPSDLEGWGLLCLSNTLFFAEEGTPKLFIRDIPNATGLGTGESHTYNVAIMEGRPLKITLVWSDSPGQALAARPLVNNLDLIVTSPDGKKFLGNQINNDGFSVVGGNPDDINNVEMVIHNKDLQGVWTITVFCAAANGRTGKQGYALVLTAALG